ncbi:hypothetical protein [Pseudobutyrivibrio sp.]|uniref:hypothetical protein n=1 Tax=Pseudobutyrivibrio sp. TaxID=2014367 RepID=UPI0038641651
MQNHQVYGRNHRNNNQQLSNTSEYKMNQFFDNIRREHDLISPAIKKNEDPFAYFYNNPRLTTEPLSPISQEEAIPARRNAQQERSSKYEQGNTSYPYADERKAAIDSYRNNRLSKVADREKQDKRRTPYTKLRTDEAHDRRKAQINGYNARLNKENLNDLNDLNNLYNDLKEKVTQSIAFTQKSKTTNPNKGKNPTTGVNNKEYNEFKKDILSKDEYNTPLQSSPMIDDYSSFKKDILSKDEYNTPLQSSPMTDDYSSFKKGILSTDEYNTPLQSSPKFGEQQNHYDRIDEKKDKRLVRGNPQSSTTSSPEIKNTRSPKLK